MNKKNVEFYNRKCKGCGSYFSSDENSPSYVPNPNEKTLYCKRCFRLKNYGIVTKDVDNNELSSVINNIKINDGLIVLILDLFDINGSIIDEYKNNKNVLILINKVSVLPKNFNRNLTFKAIQKILAELKLDSYKNIILYDSIDRQGIRTIYDTIVKLSDRKKIYFIGRTNVGKSSLINTLLSFRKKQKLITVSPYRNTTINFNKIQIDKHVTIIDTPGYPCTNSLSLLSNDIAKNIIESKLITRSFQLKKKDALQSYMFGNIISISSIKNEENASITFYGYNNVSIFRTKLENLEKNFFNENNRDIFPRVSDIELSNEEIILDSAKKYTIFLSGLGFVVLKKISKISIHKIFKDKIFISDFSII